ncbi:MAG: ATP-dependent DNA helicase RecG [Clostridiales bacterium]|nr:ATP-dependent DNA helicase RecG [Clostridiales bacterium]
MRVLKEDIQSIKGIGPKKAASFAKLGIRTIGDALSYYPREYEIQAVPIDISSIQEGLVALCIKWDGSPRVSWIRKGFSTTRIKAKDQTGVVDCIWYNQPYRANQFQSGKKYYVTAKAVKKSSGYQIQNPSVEEYNPDIHGKPQILPVYPLTRGINQRSLRSLIEEALKKLLSYSGNNNIENNNKVSNKDSKNYYKTTYVNNIDKFIASRYGLINKHEAWIKIHKPESKEDLKQAQRRLAFEEFLQLQVTIQYMRNNVQGKKSGMLITDYHNNLKDFLSRLAFKLTSAQEKVLNEVLLDMSNGKVMSRLVQGDVGSGKTVIAAAASFCAAKAGFQAAMMAPTEILARQHYESFKKIFYKQASSENSIKIGLLTGGMKVSEKEELKEELRNGNIQVVIGTHALIQDDVVFNKLGLVITDEQHRFGVRQRALLQDKGELDLPHMMVMSATPIPRTLAHILHGDLDLSTIDSMPPGRIPIKTYHVGSAYRERIYRFVNKHALVGNQTYIVCPLVEESEVMELRSAEEVYQDLSKGVLKDISMGLLHGRQKPTEKEEVVEAFAKGELQVLVSTTVIEVGINVPNAVIMIIENAERFGLSQLHQLRGRVGRGDKPSFCILVSDGRDEKTKQRMKVLVESNDGFEIAEKDLELRGPGELFGLRQHGMPVFQIANPMRDYDLYELAKEAAIEIINDPNKEQLYHLFLEKALETWIDVS